MFLLCAAIITKDVYSVMKQWEEEKNFKKRYVIMRQKIKSANVGQVPDCKHLEFQ